jgi:hypothetical protein
VVGPPKKTIEIAKQIFVTVSFRYGAMEGDGFVFVAFRKVINEKLNLRFDLLLTQRTRNTRTRTAFAKMRADFVGRPFQTTIITVVYHGRNDLLSNTLTRGRIRENFSANRTLLWRT